MSNLLTEPFDSWDDTSITGRFPNHSVLGDLTPSLLYGVHGTKGLRLPDKDRWFERTFSPVFSTIWVGRHLYVPASAAQNETIVEFKDGANVQVDIYITPTLTIGAVNGSSTVLGTSTKQLSLATWYYMEVGITFHSANGTVEVWISDPGGVNADTNNRWLNLSGKATIKAAGANQADTIRHMGGKTIGLENWIDNLYINTTADPGNGKCMGRIGQQRIFSLYPSADSQAQWLPSVGSVNADILKIKPPGASYIAADTVAQKDIYDLDDLQLVGSIETAWLKTYGMEDTAGARQFKMGLLQAGTEVQSAGKTLLTSDTTFEDQHLQAPDGADWTPAKVNATQGTLELTV